MTALQAADPAATPKIAAAIEKLTAQLPGAVTGGRVDIAKLSADQYECVRRADKIHSGEEPPGPSAPFDPNNMNDPRARLIKKLEEIAGRRERLYDEGVKLDPERIAGIERDRALAQVEKLQAENKAAAELIEALEARLALECTP
jgi:hypothetical protein